MTSDFQTRVLQRTLAIQGVTITSADDPNSPLPVFHVSDRRTITDQRATIIEQGTTQDEFENITIQTDNLPKEQNIALIEFGITTDFWFGFGQMSLSDTALIIYPPNEELKQIRWDTEDTELSPTIEFTNYTLTKNGEQPTE